jgi:predicted transglutaminase-like protease
VQKLLTSAIPDYCKVNGRYRLTSVKVAVFLTLTIDRLAAKACAKKL